MDKGLFALIRRTSFLNFFLYWIVSIFVFALIYWLVSIGSGLLLEGERIMFSLAGVFKSIYASFLIATIFGITKTGYGGIISIIVYIQIAFTIIIVLILLDKLFQKYIAPMHNESMHQDKKINTLMLMMSIFRTDVDRIKHEYTAGTKKEIKIREIEAIIDGLYVVFLDVEKMFSVRNAERNKITSIQYLMLTENIEDSLEKLKKFVEFSEHHKIVWKDRSTEFWIKYILETAEKIAASMDSHKNPRVLVAAENIRGNVEELRSLL